MTLPNRGIRSFDIPVFGTRFSLVEARTVDKILYRQIQTVEGILLLLNVPNSSVQLAAFLLVLIKTLRRTISTRLSTICSTICTLQFKSLQRFYEARDVARS